MPESALIAQSTKVLNFVPRLVWSWSESDCLLTAINLVFAKYKEIKSTSILHPSMFRGAGLCWSPPQLHRAAAG